MSGHTETNPHFIPPQEQREGRPSLAPLAPGVSQPQPVDQPTIPQVAPLQIEAKRSKQKGPQPTQPAEDQDHAEAPPEPQRKPKPKPKPKHKRDHYQPGATPPLPRPVPPKIEGPQQPGQGSGVTTAGQRKDRKSGSNGLWAPPPQHTKPITWCGAVVCAILWIVIFLGGLIVLIIYLVYRPRIPHFGIADVTLNAAYIDADSLLNADISLYANFTNPNKKLSVDFRDLILDLYFGDTLIATQYVVPFSIAKASSGFAYIHMLTSQVKLPLKESLQLQDQIERNAVTFQVHGLFRVHSYLASFLRYSYRLYGYCTFMVTAPPSGVRRAVKCKTKR